MRSGASGPFRPSRVERKAIFSSSAVGFSSSSEPGGRRDVDGEDEKEEDEVGGRKTRTEFCDGAEAEAEAEEDEDEDAMAVGSVVDMVRVTKRDKDGDSGSKESTSVALIVWAAEEEALCTRVSPASLLDRTRILHEAFGI